MFCLFSRPKCAKLRTVRWRQERKRIWRIKLLQQNKSEIATASFWNKAARCSHVRCLNSPRSSHVLSRSLKEPKTLTFTFGFNINRRYSYGMFVYNCNRLDKGSSFHLSQFHTIIETLFSNIDWSKCTRNRDSNLMAKGSFDWDFNERGEEVCGGRGATPPRFRRFVGKLEICKEKLS